RTVIEVDVSYDPVHIILIGTETCIVNGIGIGSPGNHGTILIDIIPDVTGLCPVHHPFHKAVVGNPVPSGIGKIDGCTHIELLTDFYRPGKLGRGPVPGTERNDTLMIEPSQGSIEGSVLPTSGDADTVVGLNSGFKGPVPVVLVSVPRYGLGTLSDRGTPGGPKTVPIIFSAVALALLSL